MFTERASLPFAFSHTSEISEISLTYSESLIYSSPVGDVTKSVFIIFSSMLIGNLIYFYNVFVAISIA